MIDSHCHLNFKAFRNDWREVAGRAFSGGVNGIINVGSNLETSHRAIRLSKILTGKLFASIALHPIHVANERFDIGSYENLITDSCHPDREQRVEGSLSTLNFLPSTFNSRVIAIGETGIDLYHAPENLEAQRAVFIQLIDLANKYHLPVIVHNRNAGAEVLEVLRNHKPQYGGVVHFFSEDWEYAQQLFDIGIIISFTGAITLNNIRSDTIEVIKKAPLNKILIETDSPFVVPEPMKSQGVTRNEPRFVCEVAKKIAEIKKISVDDVASVTTQNTTNLFLPSSRPK